MAEQPLRIDELADRTPLGTDYLPTTPTGGPSGRATVEEIVSAGLPAGSALAEVLAWSPANTWAPLHAELVVQHGLPRGNHTGDLLFWNDTHGAWAPSPAAPLALNLIGGAGGSIPYQNNPESTHFLPIGTAGQVLTVGANGTPGWANGLPAYTATDAGKSLIVTNEGTPQWIPLVRTGDWVQTFIQNKTANNLNVACGNVAEIFTGVPAAGLTGSLSFDCVSAIRVYVGMLENVEYLYFLRLNSVQGFITINSNKKLKEIQFSNIATVNEFQVNDNPELQAIYFSGNYQPNHFGGNDGYEISIKRNPKLTTLMNFSFFNRFRGDINFSGNALGITNNILWQLCKSVDSSFQPYGKGRSVNLSGGTNAAPTGQGITDAQTLISRGCTVTVNGTAITTTKKVAVVPDYDTATDAGKVAVVKADGTGLEWQGIYQPGWYQISAQNPPMIVPANAVFSDGLAAVNVANIIRVNGSISGSSANLQTVDFSSLMTCGGISLNNFPELTTIGFPALTSTRPLSIQNCPKLTTIRLLNLFMCESIGFTGLNTLASFEISRLFHVNGGITLSNLPELTSAPFHELMNAGSFSFYTCPKISSIYAPKLSFVGGGVILSGLTVLATFSLPRLQECVNLSVSGMPALTTVDLSNLEYLTAEYAGNVIEFTSNTPNLTTLNLGGSLRKIGKGVGNVSITSAKLDQASVDGLLVRLAALDGTGGTSVFSNRAVTITGTSVAPSATGVTAKNTLVSRGCTVTTN